MYETAGTISWICERPSSFSGVQLRVGETQSTIAGNFVAWPRGKRSGLGAVFLWWERQGKRFSKLQTRRNLVSVVRGIMWPKSRN